jgi:hypothetical protein
MFRPLTNPAIMAFALVGLDVNPVGAEILQAAVSRPMLFPKYAYIKWNVSLGSAKHQLINHTASNSLKVF